MVQFSRFHFPGSFHVSISTGFLCLIKFPVTFSRFKNSISGSRARLLYKL